jgi:CubicO group peptidase (beta-lactamase class C family)
MKTKTSYYFIIITLLLAGLKTKAQTSAADSTDFTNDQKIQTWLKENHISVLGLGVVKNGEIQKLRVYGELKNGEQAPLNTVFNVASITKTITNMVALKLVSEGKLDLDEPLYKYWIDPDLANDDRYKLLTTRIILTHQTGFANWRAFNQSKKLEFGFTPGTQYKYSGEGFEYLRRALENKFNKKLDILAQELIFKPLYMNDTRYTWDESIEKRLAIGYNEQGIAYNTPKNTQVNAADLLKTTVEDYSKFVVALLNGNVLKPAVFDEMIKHQVSLKENKYFGLGWEIYANLGGGEYALSHGGSDPGVRTQVFLFPKSKSGLIIFTNVDDGYKVYEPLLSAYFKDMGKKIYH